MSVICPNCNTDAVLRAGEFVYPHRRELAEKFFWHCIPCNIWVGCHPGTTEPLADLDDTQVRAWRTKAHDAFDPLWLRKVGRGSTYVKARNEAYQWLAKKLGIAKHDCHISLFGIEQCQRVVEVCSPYSGVPR